MADAMEPGSEEDPGSEHDSNCTDDKDMEIEDAEEVVTTVGIVTVPATVVKVQLFSGNPANPLLDLKGRFMATVVKGDHPA